MVTNNFIKSDLPSIYNIVQNSMTLYPKELIIAQLRDYFSNDSYYHYVHDAFGFPQTPDHTDLPQDVGFTDNITTRVFIGESFRFDVQYFPAIIVRHGGSTSVPISINREEANVKYDQMVFVDGNGNQAVFPTPVYFIFAGAWEGTINVDVMTKDLRARDDLVDLISLLFVDVAFKDLEKAGLVITGVSSGGTSEMDDRNDHIFKQTITLKVRSEWRRHIPIGNIIEVINTSINFARTDPKPGPIAVNLSINTTQTLIEVLNEL